MSNAPPNEKYRRGWPPDLIPGPRARFFGEGHPRNDENSTWCVQTKNRRDGERYRRHFYVRKNQRTGRDPGSQSVIFWCQPTRNGRNSTLRVCAENQRDEKRFPHLVYGQSMRTVAPVYQPQFAFFIYVFCMFFSGTKCGCPGNGNRGTRVPVVLLAIKFI
jgi:hypothetical protein